MAKSDKKLSRTEQPNSAVPAHKPADDVVSAVAPEPKPVAKKPSPLTVPVRNIFGQPVKPVTGGIGSGSAK
jgi:hypothetical protein